MKKLMIFLILFVFPITVGAFDKVNIKYVNVSDENTIWIKEDGKLELVKLYGVATTSKYSKEAINYLDKLFKDAKNIEMVKVGTEKDKYKRDLVFIYVDEIFLNKLLIENGIYQLSLKEDSNSNFEGLCEVENEAFNKELGIWKYDDTKPIICKHEHKKSEENKLEDKNLKQDKTFSKPLLYKLTFISGAILLLLIILRNKKYEK